jgi:predicted RecB family nuclease
MELTASRTIFAATDLVDFVDCAHLATLGRAVSEGRLTAPAPTDEDRLVAHKGDVHETAYLAVLRSRGLEIVEISRSPSFEGKVAAAQATERAMRAGASVIHGATLLDRPASGPGWIGVADFLIRTEGASALGGFHYDVWDAKLARTAKPSALLQMSAYAELVGRITDSVPKRVFAILGDGRIESFATADIMPYYRAAKARFLVAWRANAATYPDPVARCSRCRWNDACVARRREDDHLSLVANVKRSQIVKLHAGGITTLERLATASDDDRPRKLERSTFARLRAQAALQAQARRSAVPIYELLEPSEGAGFERLPAPDQGDLYFDMEGDPFYDGGGLEYLFGVAYYEAGDRRFASFSGHDRAGEKAAFEAFVDFVIARRARYPNLHVYHYATYEATALRKLATQHGTREDDVDTLLRGRVLVDLFEVVRQSLRASYESYSLKKIEQFYRGPRGDVVTSAMDSVVAYERFLETRDPAEFERIVTYNREDCYSTVDLHRWLLDLRAEAEATFGVQLPWLADPGGAANEGPDTALEGLAAELARDIDPETATVDERARWLAAQLLVYHRREAKPAWWAFFERLQKMTPEDLLDDAESIAELTPLDAQPELFKRSQVSTLSFPPQEHKMKTGSAYDPALGPGRAAGEIIDIDDEGGKLRLRRGPKLIDSPLPKHLCAPGPINDDKLRGALARFGRALADDGCVTRFRAARDLLYAAAPRLHDRAAGSPIDTGETDSAGLTKLVLALDESYLFVQGPPGAGKTYTGARTIVDLMARGLRVGIASTSHKAIHHLLAEIERVAEARGVMFRGYKKSSSEDTNYASNAGMIENTNDAALCAGDPRALLVAGTAWLFSDAAMQASVDVLAIDEAGQVSLADAIAMATSARSVLLLGDPMQLAQVSQAQHPAGAGASVLGHLLGDAATVSPERGVFLPHSFRMHPAICDFVSTLAYDGRLHADPACARRAIDAGVIGGAGLRYLPVVHEGNVQSSIEEAEAIASAVDDLVGASVTDEHGHTSVLRERDILVVTPYNANVRRIRQTLDARRRPDIRVGTVDKFQGQEAPVVFFSMASSRGDEAPRGIGFLFDRHRLNVAVSRAQALVVLVCSPALLETTATSVDQVVTIGNLCRFAELASPLRDHGDSSQLQFALPLAQ